MECWLDIHKVPAWESGHAFLICKSRNYFTKFNSFTKLGFELMDSDLYFNFYSIYVVLCGKSVILNHVSKIWADSSLWLTVLLLQVYKAIFTWQSSFLKYCSPLERYTTTLFYCKRYKALITWYMIVDDSWASAPGKPLTIWLFDVTHDSSWLFREIQLLSTIIRLTKAWHSLLYSWPFACRRLHVVQIIKAPHETLSSNYCW